MTYERKLTPKMDAMFNNDLSFTGGAQHGHTDNSTDDAVATCSEFAEVASEYNALAAIISDHGTCMGWDDFDEAVKKLNEKLVEQGKKPIKPIFGVEAYYLDPVTKMKSHLIIYAMNEAGLRKITKAMSRGIVIANRNEEEDGFTCLTDEALEYLKGGDVVATSACIGGVFGSIIIYNDRINNKVSKLEAEIEEFLPSVQKYEEAQKAYEDAIANVSILQADVTEAKAASKKSFTGKQKQVDSMKKKLEKAEAAFEKFLQEGTDKAAKSVRVALAQLEVVVEDEDDFQSGIEEAQSKYNQRVAQIRSDVEATEKLAKTLDEKTAKLEAAKAARAEAKSVLDSVAKDVAKVENKRAKIAELEATKLTKEQSMEVFNERLAKMLEVFGKNFFIEIQNHGLDLEKSIFQWLVKVARKNHIPLIAANDAHFARNTDDDLMARQIRRSCRFKRWEEIEDDATEYYIKTDKELALALYQIFDEDVVIEAMTNVRKLVEMCNATIERGNHAPKAKGVENVKEEMIRIARANIAKKYGKDWSQMHEDRFNYEVSIIDSMGFNDYFVITWDILNVARKIGGLSYEKLDELKAQMVNMEMDELMSYLDKYNTEPNLSVGLGRGSGAGSLVCFLLGITNIDPFKYDLLFERKKRLRSLNPANSVSAK